jgi:sulfate adenylyltransferase (ADP) / ATP adenylyltransferase
LVARLPGDCNATHNLVLNKYPVIPRHSILSTVVFKRQTDLLESQDLEIAYSCLQAWESESKETLPSRLFAFFNSGEHSGASQSHRHLQFLPIEDMMDPGSPEAEWRPLIDTMTEALPDDLSISINPSLSFCHYAMRIPQDPDTGILQHTYHCLYKYASKAVRFGAEEHCPEHAEIDDASEEASISYNLAMTTQTMAICPRRSETAKIPTTAGEGSAAVNGTILGGTLMVKELSEWEALQESQATIDDVLAEIGLPMLSNSKDTSNSHL